MKLFAYNRLTQTKMPKSRIRTTSRKFLAPMILHQVSWNSIMICWMKGTVLWYRVQMIRNSKRPQQRMMIFSSKYLISICLTQKRRRSWKRSKENATKRSSNRWLNMVFYLNLIMKDKMEPIHHNHQLDKENQFNLTNLPLQNGRKAAHHRKSVK